MKFLLNQPIANASLSPIELRSRRSSFRRFLIASVASLCCTIASATVATVEAPSDTANANVEADTETRANIDEALQELKKEVLALNRDLFILKEELMFPAHTQVAVFLSMDVGEFFELDSLSIKLDDKPVASHLYTPKQTNALVRGGVQRLYLGNLKHGEHELVAVFTGRGPQGRDYRRATSFSFVKNDEATHLEVKISDSERLMQPEFSVKHWN